MESYISIKGNKTVLTDQQLQELGIYTGIDFSGVDEAEREEIERLSKIVRSGKAQRKLFANDIIKILGKEYKVIGFDHDKIIGNSERNTITLVRYVLLPPRSMSGSNWRDSGLRKYLNEEYIKELPDALVEHIHPVRKITHTHDGEKIETEDRLFIPSESELFGSAIYSDYEDGKRYEAFSTSENRQLKGEDGDYWYYWTRSNSCGVYTHFAHVNSGGTANSLNASNATIRVPLCFCFS